MTQGQFGAPVVVRDGRASILQRVRFDGRDYDEAWLQQLLFDHPRLLPIGEIEPWFDDALPVVRELPTAAGPLDLLYVNARGYLTLVETKLWRNPQARREVVGQLIDYAKEIARWSYGDLAAAIRLAGVGRFAADDDPLVSLARASEPDLDERDFVDNVQRGLRRGQFLMLIVGDGIREEVVQITDYLQSTPSLRFTLGLVEMAMFRAGDGADGSGDGAACGTLYVQPRTLAKTELLTRAVVEVKVAVRPEDVVVTLPSEEQPAAKVRGPITEEEFLRRMSANATPEVTDFVRWALAEMESAAPGLVIRWGQGGPMFKYADAVTGKEFTLCGFGTAATLTNTDRISGRCRELGLPDSIWERHLYGLAALFQGGQISEYSSSTGDPWSYVTVGGKSKRPPPLAELVPQRDAWRGVLTGTVEAIREATGRL